MLLCCPSSSSLCQWSLFPSINGVAYPLATRLWKLHFGWATSPPSAATPVCAQRCSLVIQLSRCDHITDALAVLHWLRLPQRVDDYHVAVMAYRADRLQYQDQLVRVADIPGRHRLRSSSSHRLEVLAYHLATVGRRSFPASASILWNNLASWYSVIFLVDRFQPQTKDIGLYLFP